MADAVAKQCTPTTKQNKYSQEGKLSRMESKKKEEKIGLD